MSLPPEPESMGAPPALDVLVWRDRDGAWAARARGGDLESSVRGYGTPGQAAHAALFTFQARMYTRRWRQDAPGRAERLPDGATYP